MEGHIEQTRIVRMNSQLKGPGLLEMIEAGEAGAAIELQDLVQKNFISKSQLPMIFASAALNASDRKEEVEEATQSKRAFYEMARAETHKLACVCAWKMTVLLPGYISSLDKAFMYAVTKPDQVTLGQLNDLGIGQMVLIGQGILRNGKIIGMAEAIAEGLKRTEKGPRREILETIAEAVRSRMPSDISETYKYIFEHATLPKETKNVTLNCFLDLMFRRELGKTDPNEKVIERLVNILCEDSGLKSEVFIELMLSKEEGKVRPNEIVIQNLKKIRDAHLQAKLEKQLEVLSDGDAKLPTSHIKKRRKLLERAKALLPFVKGRGGSEPARARR